MRERRAALITAAVTGQIENEEMKWNSAGELEACQNT
jgi:hypothetical protein